jgi:hypothetical protein
MTTTHFAAYAEPGCHTLADCAWRACRTRGTAEESRAEIGRREAELPALEAAATAAEVRAQMVPLQTARFGAAHLPSGLCYTHTLAEATPIELVGGVPQDAEGDLIGLWPAGTQVVIHRAPRSTDPGWCEVIWPDGAAGKHLHRSDEQIIAAADRAKRTIDWLREDVAAVEAAEPTLTAEEHALLNDLCDAFSSGELSLHAAERLCAARGWAD